MLEQTKINESFSNCMKNWNCPENCPHLKQKRCVDKVSKTCYDIATRGLEMINAKLSYKTSGYVHPRMQISASDKKLLVELNQALIDALKVFKEE